MKKIIFILIFPLMLFAKDGIVLYQKQKETNSTNSETLIIKKFIINTFNSILPNYLQVQPKENFIHMKIGYDPLEKQLSENVKINVILPSFEKTVKQSSITKISTKTKTYTFKITPFFTIYHSSPTFVIKPSFAYEYQLNDTFDMFSKSFAFSETLYYYTFQNDFKEISQIILKRFISIDNLQFKASKTYYSTDPHNLYYQGGLYFYNDLIKSIKIYGLTASGNRKQLPAIYSYKLFFTYRHILFDKKYFYVEISPYLLFSKEWQYRGKFFASVSLNIKF